MARDTAGPGGGRRKVVDALRDEYEAIHGSLGPEENEENPDRDLDARLRAFYGRVHSLPSDRGRSALCLSGGGIRSASFSFGALRALARAGVLHRFHYLSTVSGGGYIGSWLTAWIHRRFREERQEERDQERGSRPRARRLADLARSLASHPEDGGLGGDRPPEADAVAHIRRFTSYLSPRSGIFSLDTWTLAAVYLRNLFLNWLVVLPLLGAALLVPRLAMEAISATGRMPGEGTARLAAVLAPALVAYVGWLALVLRTVVLHAVHREASVDVGRTEDWSRGEGRWLMAGTLWAVLAALVLYGPKLLGATPSLLAAAGGVSGIATVLLKKLGDRRREAAGAVDAPARGVRMATGGAAVLTVALILIVVAWAMDHLANWARDLALLDALPVPDPAHPLATSVLVGLVALAVSAGFGALVDLNEFSLHALYRNRLVRAFLRASRNQDEYVEVRDEAFDADDDLPLARLWPAPPVSDDPEEAPHLFHVLNATLNDLGGSRPEWNERKGASFTFSPLHIGAHITGRYGEPGPFRGGYRSLRPGPDEYDPLTLGTAMSVSGAAANPNMGFHSSAAVTFLLALFNARLGWWLPAPWERDAGSRLSRSPRAVWRTWWAEALGGTRFTAPVVNVSDGGHFDNLALYEMVRRRCRFIVVLDAGQDQDDTFASLGEAIRKVRVDFGVPITMAGLDLSDGTKGRGDGGGPPGHAWHGTVHYSRVDRVPAGDGQGTVPAPDGELIYIRPAVSGDEPVDVQAYRRLNPVFPHESTVDQWFSESQFESYRSLGEHTVQHLLDYYHATKGQLRAGRRPGGEVAMPRLSPRLFCHQVAEALALMRRHKELSSHAGGVLYRQEDDRLEFLLIRSIDDQVRVLPKGYVEPWEDAATAAVREVREEAGYSLTPVQHLGVASFETKTRHVTTTYFLMEEVTEEGARPLEGFRDPVWKTLEEWETRKSEVPPDVIRVLEKARERIPTHAGGVVHRHRNDRVEFLLVRSSDGTHRVLPKGHIEPGEGAAGAAEREVREETGLRAAAVKSLGISAFEVDGAAVRVEYFLMDEDAEEGEAGPRTPGEPGRDPRWYTVEGARREEGVPPDVIRLLEQTAEALAEGA